MMKIQETSIRSFASLVDSGFFQTQQGIVYRLLERHGPATQREIEHYHEAEYKIGSQSLLRRRFSELEKRGFIKPTGKRRCRVSGKEALTWQIDPTNQLNSVRTLSKTDLAAKQMADIACQYFGCPANSAHIESLMKIWKSRRGK